ncbi:armadillo repeat-containing protein 3 [Ambystoma mexicanum]|uniref:armadillo repeat-containing protein 3 n=1 Tax=Ambystoma mexicanum TaxID=8296 RepID=UPI0037E9469C
MGKKVKKEAEPPPKDVFDPLPIESKKVATVVLMLQSPEEEVLNKACESLYKFANKGDENKATLLELGILQPLLSLIGHEDMVVRRNATMVMGSMAAHSEARQRLRTVELFPVLIARLAPDEDTVTHEFASLCLAYMSIEFTSKAKILEHNGLEPLVRLLSSPDPDVKKNSVECIYQLVQDFQSRAALCQLQAVPPLLELLKSEYPIIQLLALKTLATLSYDAEARLQLKENDALAQLLKILELKDLNDLHVEALSVVIHCLEDIETMQLLQQTGGLKQLLTFMETSPIPEVQANAAMALGKAAQNNENRKMLSDQEAEHTLVTLLVNGNDDVRSAACQAISIMCSSVSSKDLFRKEGIPQIVRLLGSDNSDVRESAVLALANLTTNNPSNASAVMEAEGVELLIKLLSDDKDGTVAHCATVVINMASQDALRLSIQAHGVMQAIVKPLQSSNSIVLSKAALTVAAVACDADARAEFRSAGGLKPLVQLLQSKYDEVRRNACWAVMVCTNDELTAAELYSLGALEILKEINLSTSRRNHFSEGAQSKLFDNNLSLKYSQKGYLASINIISDGFYDCGRIKSDAKILSLEELSKQEVNDHRAVILVNAKQAEHARPQSPSLEEKPDASAGRSPTSVSRKERRVSSPVEQETSSGRSPSLSRGSLKEKVSRGKIKTKKEEEKLKDEEEHSLRKMSLETVHEKPWFPPFDFLLHNYVDDVTHAVLPHPNTKDQVVLLAQFVANKMGGPVEKDKLNEFGWELHISELKFRLKTNVIPIGAITKGIFCHRALLFKVLADRIGIGCYLIRGEYYRAWNEVNLQEGSPSGTVEVLRPPEAYIVDLMHQPGRLMKVGSTEADLYQHI